MPAILRRRWGSFLLSWLLLSGAVLAWAWAQGPRTWTASSRVALRDERRALTAADIASLGLREFDAADLEAAAAGARVEREEGRFRLTATAATPEDAAAAASAAARAAQEAARRHAGRLLDEAAGAVEKRLREARERRELAEAALGPGDAETRDLERRAAAVNASLAEIERRKQEALARGDRALARARALEADEHRLREALPVGPEEDALRSPVLDRIRKEMEAVRSEIALARDPDHPDTRAGRERLLRLQEAFRAELYRERARTIVSLRESAVETRRDVQDLEERAMRKGLDLAAFEEKRRWTDPRRAEAAAARKAIEALEELRGRAARARESGQGVLAVVEAESPAARLEKGRAWSRVPAALAGAFVLALAFSWLRERADRRVRTGADVRRYLNLPCLAMVGECASDDPLVLRAPAHDPLSEAYATAATVLRSYLAEREFKAVLVTGAQAGEGKSTAAANLAASLARKGLSVALVDADFRAPRLGVMFGSDSAQGLSTWLLGGDDPNFYATATELATLHLLPSGAAADVPPETLESARMGDLLRSLRERYDAVIVDGPPLLAAGEALALARMVDTTVWVVRSGQADGRTLGWTKHLLKNVRADVAGVILNFAPDGAASGLVPYPAPARV